MGSGTESDGQDAPDAADLAAQGEFADDAEIGQARAIELVFGGEHAQGDGQVEAGAFLFDVGGGEIDGGAAHGGCEAGVDEGGPDAVGAFLDGGVGEADDDDLWIAVAGVDFDFDFIGIHAEDGAGEDLCEHWGTPYLSEWAGRRHGMADAMGELCVENGQVGGWHVGQPGELQVLLGNDWGIRVTPGDGEVGVVPEDAIFVAGGIEIGTFIEEVGDF